jgi:hypothetical protein
VVVAQGVDQGVQLSGCDDVIDDNALEERGALVEFGARDASQLVEDGRVLERVIVRVTVT